MNLLFQLSHRLPSQFYSSLINRFNECDDRLFSFEGQSFSNVDTVATLLSRLPFQGRSNQPKVRSTRLYSRHQHRHGDSPDVSAQKSRLFPVFASMVSPSQLVLRYTPFCRVKDLTLSVSWVSLSERIGICLTHDFPEITGSIILCSSIKLLSGLRCETANL